MNRNRRNHNNYLHILKDYTVPIVWVLLVLIIIISRLWGWKDPEIWRDNLAQSSQANSYALSFDTEEGAAEIIYSWGRKENLSEWSLIYSWETIKVLSWRARLNSWDNTKIRLNDIAEFRIDGPGKYSLLASDAWIESQSPVSITMRYAEVNTTWNSIISLTQNEAWSTIYVLRGDIEVKNMVWVQTRVTTWERISVPRLQASNKDFDIWEEKVNLDTFFQNSDWFLVNDWHLINLDESPQEDIVDWENQAPWSETSLLRFDRLRDEMSIDSSSIDISGTLLSDDIGAISIQNIPADIDVTSRSFALDNIVLTQALNDLVVKIYDTERNILRKEVFTVYTSNPSVSQNSNTVTSTESPQTNNQASSTQSPTHFDIDASQFRFTAPSTNWRYTTSNNEITIRWETTASDIARVEVNGFRLNSFNWRTWRYHAFQRFDTIRDGTNQYRVDYYGKDGRLVYTDFFTIIKQAPWSQSNTTNQNTPSDITVAEWNNDVTDEPELMPEPETVF